MSLTLKTFLVGYAILIFFGATIFATSRQVLLPGFAELGENDLREDLQRVAHLLAHDLATMSATAADWAEWDDIYQFMADGNATFIESNLAADTFVGLNFNALYLIDESGQVFFSQSVDLATGEIVDSAAGFDVLLEPGSLLLVHDGPVTSRSGIVRLPHGSVMVAANAIFPSVNDAPPRGTLMWVRHLDDSTAQQLESLYNLPVALFEVDDPLLPDSVSPVRDALASDNMLVTPESDTILAGYIRLDDLFGNPALILRLEKPRAILAHGIQLVNTLIGALLVGGFIAVTFMVTVFRRVMLNRVFRLTALVNHVRVTGDLTVAVPEEGRDEIGQLANGFATMLDTLRQTHDSLEQARTGLEQRVAERTAELRQSKDDVEAILANTGDVIIQTATDFRIVRANPAFNRLFGYPWQQVAGQPLDRIVLPEMRENLRDAIRSVTSGTAPGRIDLSILRADGSTLESDVALSGVFEEDGSLRSVIAVVRDMTERKNAELRQAELSSRLRRVLSLASALIDSADTDTLCRRAVEAMQAELKLERCSIFLERSGFLHGTYGIDGRGKITDEHNQSFATNDTVWQSRQQLLNPDAPRWIVVDEPHYEWDGEETRVIGHGWVAITPIVTSRGFLGIFVNDTALSKTPHDPLMQEIMTVFCSLFGALYEHKQAEESVRAALDRQIELNALKARFVSMVSHEFRTPLAVIQTSVDIMQRYSDRITDERRSEYLHETERQVQHMKTLMEDYLLLDRAEFGRIQVGLSACDIVALCRDTIDEMLIVSPTREIQFSTPFDSYIIDVDSGLLKQVIVNLLSNAIKYSEDNTVVRLELSRDDDSLVLTVRDEGIGIPENEQEQLFATFFRGSNARHLPGTGLGLAIVKRAVEAHNGSLAVKSEVGVGTVVTLSLPVAAAEAAVATSQSLSPITPNP